mmetsp:Transcript_10677/g.22374  ORF Transcript_10677/g.22374 Transcript_10677/m.22374 type:complete len:210 (-) Transcript_10677:495-1124(-)
MTMRFSWCGVVILLAQSFLQMINLYRSSLLLSLPPPTMMGLLGQCWGVPTMQDLASFGIHPQADYTLVGFAVNRRGKCQPRIKTPLWTGMLSQRYFACDVVPCSLPVTNVATLNANSISNPMQNTLATSATSTMIAHRRTYIIAPSAMCVGVGLAWELTTGTACAATLVCRSRMTATIVSPRDCRVIAPYVTIQCSNLLSPSEVSSVDT